MTQSTVSKPMNLLTFLVACGCLFSSTVVPGCFPPPPTNRQDTASTNATTTNNTTIPVTCKSFTLLPKCPNPAPDETHCPNDKCDKKTCCLQPREIEVRIYYPELKKSMSSYFFNADDDTSGVSTSTAQGKKIEDSVLFNRINMALQEAGFRLTEFADTSVRLNLVKDGIEKYHVGGVEVNNTSTGHLDLKAAFATHLSKQSANTTGVFRVLVLKHDTEDDKIIENEMPDRGCMCTGGCVSVWKKGTALDFLNQTLHALDSTTTTTTPTTTTTTTAGPKTNVTAPVAVTTPSPNSLAALKNSIAEWPSKNLAGVNTCLRHATPRTASSGLSPYAIGGIVAGGLFAIAVLSYVVVRAKKSGNDKAGKEKVPINGGAPGTRKTNGGGRHPPRRAIE